MISGVLYFRRSITGKVGATHTFLLAWITVGFAPVVTAVKLGQITTLLGGALCALAVYIYPKGTAGKWVRGPLTVIICLYKLYFAPLAAHLLTNRKHFERAAFTGVLVTVVTFIVFDLDTLRSFLQHVVVYWLTDRSTVNVWRASRFQPLVVLEGYRVFVKGGILLLVIIISLTHRDRDLRVYFLGLSVIPLASPRINTVSLVALLPIYVYFLGTGIWNTRRELFGYLSLLLVQAHPYTMEFLGKFGPKYIPEIRKIHPLLPVLQPGLWGVLILFGLMVLETIRPRTRELINTKI